MTIPIAEDFAAIAAGLRELSDPEAGYGTEEGEPCGRPDCAGVIEFAYDERKGGCSCHISPPCGYCTSSYPHCPVCGWEIERE